MNPALDIATSTERVEPAHKLRCAEPRYDLGGGINVARAVHTLGGEAAALPPDRGAGGKYGRRWGQHAGWNCPWTIALNASA